MKKNFFVLICLLSFCTPFSQNPLPGYPKTLLWKISANNLLQPSYIFGTMHILCADEANLSESMKKIIGQCDEIYFEIDMTDMMGMMSAMKYMRMNDDKKLSDILSKPDYAKVKRYFENHSPVLPFSMLERFKPMLISSLMEQDDLPCKTTDGMELVIMKEAKDQNKKISGLETASFQASLFDSIPYQDQAQDLIKYIDSSDQYKKMTDTLAKAYAAQDLNKIEELTLREDPSAAGYMDLLLYARNRKWVSKIKQLLPGKSLLFAVGAGHLPGEQGLISLLRKNGYTVTPVMSGQ
ncbi:MAG TPA: TraB/GumN family protein [Puia sp.]|nr:TraB/GumN family protein [Puia sp.]